jgi:hypothetical protein
MPPKATTIAKKATKTAAAGANDVLEDEYGLHRQPTTSVHGTVLRGASFNKSVQQIRAAHRERLAKSAQDAANAVSAISPDVTETASNAAEEEQEDEENNEEEAGARMHHARGEAAAPPLSLVNSPQVARDADAQRPSTDGGGKSSASSSVSLMPFSREPTMLHSSTQLLPSPRGEKRYTVVLDLDETVIYGREGALSARAHLKHFLRAIDEVAEVVVWTAGERSYAKAVVKEINTEGVIRHLVYRDEVWFNESDYTKDLRKLGRDTDYVLIVENTPDCVRENPMNGIIVSDFEGTTKRRDETLLKLTEVVQALVKSALPVPKFLPTCRLLRRQTVVSEDGREIPIFYLSGRVRQPHKDAAEGKEDAEEADEADAPSEAKVVKTNRDKKPAVAENVAVTPTTPSRKRAAPETGVDKSSEPAVTKGRAEAPTTRPKPPTPTAKERMAAVADAVKRTGGLRRVRSDDTAGRPSAGALTAPKKPAISKTPSKVAK